MILPRKDERQYGPLGEFVELKRGYDLPHRERRDGPVPIISSSGSSGTHVEAKVKGPGVVTGRYGTIGQVFFVEQDFWPLNTSLYVRDFKGNDPRFVYYFLKTIQYHKYVDKAAVPGINRNHLHLEPVSVPPLDEQRRIAAVLGALDDKIELNRKMNRTLEEMAQALFKSWFIDFDGHDDFEDSELGPIPRGWKVGTLGDHITLHRGLSYKGKHLSDQGTPMVNLKCILPHGGFRRDGLKHYDGDYKRRHVVKPGDLVVANTDLTQARDILGCPAFVPRIATGGDVITSHHTYSLHDVAGRELPKHFIYYSLLTPSIRDRCRGFATGTTVLAMQRDVLEKAAIILAPMEDIHRFSTTAEVLHQRIDANHQESDTLTELRDTLLPKLISGELRVPQAEALL